jgi:hypothetical protein
VLTLADWCGWLADSSLEHLGVLTALRELRQWVLAGVALLKLAVCGQLNQQQYGCWPDA